MIKYCMGIIYGDQFFYVKEESGGAVITQALSEAYLFTLNQIQGTIITFPGFVWLPVFLTEDLKG